jgi:hypothetical protein
MKVMGGLVFACIVVGGLSALAAQKPSPATVPPCRTAEVTVSPITPTVRVGTRPQFSVAITNKSDRPIRLLDVPNGRRKDLEHSFFELFILEGSRLVDLPIAISDPTRPADTDYTVAEPGERIEVRTLSYTREAERLPPGKYSAFILFSQDPNMPYTSRCRSSEGRFVVVN